MRNYVLTPAEREIMIEYLTTGKKLDRFRLILSSARRHNPEAITEEEELIRQFLLKANTK